jgi:hypothetical protein
VQQSLPAQVAAGMRPQIQPNGRQLSPAELAQYQRIRQAQMIQAQQNLPAGATPAQAQQLMMAAQQQATQAALGGASAVNPGNGSAKAALRMPTHQDLTNQLRQSNPQASQVELNVMAQQQLQVYHARLSNDMAMRNPSLRQQQAAQQQQQRQNSNTGILMSANGPVGPGSASLPSSRSATPQGPQQANGVSPRIPQQQQQPPTAPMAGQMQQPQ